MDFSTLYEEYLVAVERRLNQVLKVKEPKSVYEPVNYLIASGGKRIRPILAMIAADAVGSNPLEAVDCAAAIEILHNFTLVHDDIMDKSPLRRGRDTVHIKWDEPTAILAGDIMIGVAYKLLPISKTHERSEEIFSVFTNALIEVCEGQAYDMEFNSKHDVGLKEYFNMIEKKTAKLLEASALIGAHFGSADPIELEALKNYARYCGIAFQLQDDLLDIISETAEFGKSIGQDIIDGKKTYLILRAVEILKEKEQGLDQEKMLLERFYQKNGLPKDDVLIMKDIFYRLGIINEINQQIDELFNKAQSQLESLDNNRGKAMLAWLIQSLNRRKY